MKSSRTIFAGGASVLAISLFACATTEKGPGTAPTEPDANPEPDANLNSGRDASTEQGPDNMREPSTCTPGGFCFTAVPPVGPFRSISGTSIDDAWGITDHEIVRWSGASWRGVQTIADGALVGVWGAKKDDAWFLVRETSLTGVHLLRYSALGGNPPALRRPDAPAHAYHYASNVRPHFWATPASDELWLLDYQFGFPMHHAVNVARFREASDGTLTVDTQALPADTGDGASYRWHSLWGFGANDVYVGGSKCPRADCSSNKDDYRSAIAHYDGTDWSITALDDRSKPVLAIYGTAPASTPRQLWLALGAPDSFAGPTTYWGADELRLIPVDNGSIGASIYSFSLRGTSDPLCGFVFGSAISANAAWFSDGCLVYRWDETKLDFVPTTLDGAPTGKVAGIWAANADDAWIVGQSTIFEKGFAAKRTKESAQNGTSP